MDFETTFKHHEDNDLWSLEMQITCNVNCKEYNKMVTFGYFKSISEVALFYMAMNETFNRCSVWEMPDIFEDQALEHYFDVCMSLIQTNDETTDFTEITKRFTPID